jgi:short subunit dehydrogenase-like uncharacterized protein
MADTHFDLILIGATGFTGKRAAKYLKDNSPKSLTWGIAARNSEKLLAVAEEVGLSPEQSFIVDTTNQEDVENVVKQAKVIMTTVGPFSLYGEKVIAACAKFGSHYLDITGEVGFIKEMEAKYGDLARKNGALIIPFSGFDSVPADIAAYLLASNFNSPEKLTIKAFYSISGGFNGGTIATMLNKFETGEYKKMGDPKLLLTEDDQNIHSPNDTHYFGYDKKIARWSSPFIMGAINSKVVYKSASIMRHYGKPYANSISYSEHSSLGKWYNPLPFIFVSIILISITLFGPQKWFRLFLKMIMPKPGEGPSEEQIEKGYFIMNAFAQDHSGNKGQLKMSYPGDPGNKSTVFFLCETALCLLQNKDRLGNKRGFMTPTSALQDHLVQHLIGKGLLVNHISS